MTEPEKMLLSRFAVLWLCIKHNWFNDRAPKSLSVMVFSGVRTWRKSHFRPRELGAAIPKDWDSEWVHV